MRISEICRTGPMRSRGLPSRQMRRPRDHGARDIRTGVPRRVLGVKSSRKCGSRSCHGPGTPSCCVRVGGGHSWHRMAGTVRQPGVHPALLGRPGAAVVGAALDPQLVVQRALPVGEHAHAVAAGEDLREAGVQPFGREVVVHVLPDIERGDDVKGQAGDDAERAKPDDGAAEPVAGTGWLSRAAGSPSRLRTITSPSAVTISMADTAVARLPFASPEPWVLSRTRLRSRCAAAIRGCAVHSPQRAGAGQVAVPDAGAGCDGGAASVDVHDGRQAGRRDEHAGVSRRCG